MDQRRLAELAAEPADGDLNDVAERVEILVPHPVQQLLGAHHGTVREHQRLQHAELLAGQ
jgi:hypothetical protein